MAFLDIDLDAEKRDGMSSHDGALRHLILDTSPDFGCMLFESDARLCSVCGKEFGLGVGVARPEKVYCSDACRSKAYRRRKGAETGIR